MHTQHRGGDAFKRARSGFHLGPSAAGVEGRREGGREEGKEAVIFKMAFVLSNKETSSLAWRGRACEKSGEEEDVRCGR